MSAATPISWKEHTADEFQEPARRYGSRFTIVLTPMPHCIG